MALEDESWYCEWDLARIGQWVRPNEGSGPFSFREAVETLKGWPSKINNTVLTFRVENDVTGQVVIIPATSVSR